MVGADTPLLVHASCHDHPLLRIARQAGWRIECTASSDQIGWVAAAAYIASNDTEACALRALCPDAIAIGASADIGSVDVSIPENATSPTLVRLLGHAGRVADLHNTARRDEAVSKIRRRRTRQLADIGIALSAQRDPVKLLEVLLAQARQLADCDAGSLYLIEESNGVRSLHFKLAQNDTASVPFREARLPLTTDSLSGYVALTGTELNVADAYEISSAEPYAFNRSFDEQLGYRTRSLLVAI